MITYGNLHIFFPRDLFLEEEEEKKRLLPSGYFQRPDGLAANRRDGDSLEAIDIPAGWTPRGNFVEDAIIAAIDAKKQYA